MHILSLLDATTPDDALPPHLRFDDLDASLSVE